MPKAARSFVKSDRTATQVSTSKVELERMLKRYGATGYSVSEDYAARRVILSIVLPDHAGRGAPRIPVKLPVDVRAVYDALYGRPRNNGYNSAYLDQAERVAWRNLVLWVDAALSAATIGLQTITEAFFAHTVAGENGERMIEVVERAQAQLGAGVQRLLEAPAE